MQFLLQEPFLEALKTPSCTVNHQLKHTNRNPAGSPRIPHHLAPKHTAGRPGSLALKRLDGPLGHCLEGWTLQAATLFPAPGIPDLQVAGCPGSRSSIKGFLRALSYRQELANSLFPVSWFLHRSQPYFSHQQELTVGYSLEGQTDWLSRPNRLGATDGHCWRLQVRASPSWDLIAASKEDAAPNRWHVVHCLLKTKRSGFIQSHPSYVINLMC